MLTTIQDKALEVYLRLQAKLREIKDDARGVVSAEFIAVTAVAVLIAITVIYAVFSEALSEAIKNIGDELNSWIDGEFEGIGDDD